MRMVVLYGFILVCLHRFNQLMPDNDMDFVLEEVLFTRITVQQKCCSRAWESGVAALP